MKVPSEADTLDLSVEVLEVRTVRKRASSSSHFPVVKPHGVKHERKNRHKHSRSPTAETIRALFAQNSDLIEDIEDSTSASSQSSVSSSSSISSISYDLQLKRAMIAKSKHPTGRSPKSKKNVIMPILAYNPKQKRVNVVLQPATPKGKTTKTTSKVLLGRDPGGNSQTSVCSSRNYGDLALKLTGLHSKDPTFKSNMPQYHRLQLDFHQLTFTGMSFFVDKIPITQTTSPSELQTLINTCGGNVYVHIRDFTALCSERVGVSSANQPKPLFVSDTSRSNCRKFLLAVCCRATLVSHKWIVECTQRRSICPIGQYILPAGIDTFTKTPVIFSCKDDLIPVTPLQNSTAAISGTAEFTKAWSQILKQLGAQVLSPSSSSTKSPDYIVSQSFPSTSPPRHIPALTAQWVIQCALSGLWVDHTTSPALHWELATNQIIATPSQLQSHSQSPKAASAPHSTITKSRSEVLPPTQPHQQRETPHNPTTKRRRVASAL
ncbi:hypothetical protein Pelo_8581 [Pelomyxa schiedti]|nr:hypothetical protein Pelo_8581 [Pelomyxa schiedti]